MLLETLMGDRHSCFRNPQSTIRTDLVSLKSIEIIAFGIDQTYTHINDTSTCIIHTHWNVAEIEDFQSKGINHGF